MGFPLSTFQQLSALCRDEPFVRNTFERFKQIAIIVHDPADDGFRRQVKYAFEHLHEVTGEGFAFISFVNPPRRWADTHKDWMEEREMLSAGDGCEDPEFVRALQRRLDLPDGPSLVLTDDLLSDRYVILPSSAGELVPQMEAVSDYVNGHPGRIPAHSSEYLSFLSRLGPAFDERTPDGESLAKNIADLIAVRALTGAGAVRDRFARHVQKEDAYSYVRKVLKTLWNDLDTRRADGDEERASECIVLVALPIRAGVINPFNGLLDGICIGADGLARFGTLLKGITHIVNNPFLFGVIPTPVGEDNFFSLFHTNIQI